MSRSTVRRRKRLARSFQVESLEGRWLLSGNPNVVNQTYTVTSLADSGQGTLRDAIKWFNEPANANPLTATPDYVKFAIPSAGQQITISVLTPLPPIMVPLEIDGYSQPGSISNTDILNNSETDVAVLMIRLDGTNAVPATSGGTVNGLTIAALNCTVDGLSITSFTGSGIELDPDPDVTIDQGAIGTNLWGNFIGVASFDPTLFNDFWAGSQPWLTTTGNAPIENNLRANGTGITITSSNNRIGGTLPPDRNVIMGNTNNGVVDSGAVGTGNLIEGNYILSNAGNGVFLTTSNNFVGEAIGAGPAGGGNIISGNGLNGVYISGPAAGGNVVVNNEIGTEVGLKGEIVPVRGMNPRPNLLNGVLIQDAPGNIIGGTLVTSFNVIAANGQDGVSIQNDLTTDATRNQVLGNHIGYNNREGTTSILPNRDGINISSANNTIGGSVAASQNIIINNMRNGITISSYTLDTSNVALAPILIPQPSGPALITQPTGNVIEGNFIGTQGGGDDYGNTLEGILIYQATDNTIGGTTDATRNVISGNNYGIIIRDPASSDNVVEGNYIGAQSDGKNILANAIDGVLIDNSPGNTIGGTAAGAGNVLSGNVRGLHISGSTATGNLVEGNFVGTDRLGVGAIRNSLDGILIDDDASNNTIGGTVSGAGNIIGYNVGDGIAIGSGTGNAIVSNSIFTNNELGINLVEAGDPPDQVTPNDPINPDTGANDRQNYPVLAFAASDATSTNVQGTFHSALNTTYLLQFFSSTYGNPSGYGEGQTLLGSETVTTDGSGNYPTAASGLQDFTFVFQSVVPASELIAATATVITASPGQVDQFGDSSEFSNTVPSVPVNVEFGTVPAPVPNTAGTATILVTRSGGLGALGGVATVDYATVGGTAVAGTDYTSESGTLTFPPNQADASFSIPILNSGAVGPYSTIEIMLSNPTGGATIVGTNPAILTIDNTNHQANVQFAVSTLTVNENSGQATIAVTRNTAIGTATVGFATGGGTAVAGHDYTAVSKTLTFNPGQTSQTVTIPILDASVVGGPHTVDLALSNPTGAILGTASTATLTILDNDSPGALSYSTSFYDASAGAGGVVVITVNRVGGKAGQVAVNYATSNGTAAAGTDYTASSGTLTFGPGVVTQTFSIPLLNDPNGEAGKTFKLSLSNPTGGATLGATATATVEFSGSGPAPLVPGTANGPVVQDVQLLNNGHAITGIALSFNEPLNAASAQNLNNYGSYLISAGSDGVFGTNDDYGILIQSAAYDPATFQVVLTPASPLPLNTYFKIGINQQANPLVGSGLTDASGNLLAGGPYTAIVGLGTKFVYRDASNNLVTLQIAKGGLIELRRAASGNAEQVRIVNAIARKSTLTGQVRGPRHATTPIPIFLVPAGVRVRLKAPPFRFG